MSTATVEKRRSANAALSVWDELALLEQQVAMTAAAVPQIEADRRAALGDLTVARTRLEGFYNIRASERDPEMHERFVQHVAAAEQAAARPFDAELVGAQEAARRAEDEREAFIDEHFKQLVEDLAARSTAVRAHTLELIQALIHDSAAAALGAEWTRILGPLERRPGMQAISKRLIGFGQNTHSNVLDDCAAQVETLNNARTVLQQFRPEKFRRAIPPCFDGELQNEPWGESL